MNHQQPHTLRYSFEEYLALEENADIRYEYRNGEVYAMTPHEKAPL
ncbi:MAG: Uma2 family endonuclease [Bacteroidota bacterium]